MPYTLTLMPNEKRVEIYADDHGLDLLYTLLQQAKHNGTAVALDPDGKIGLLVVHEKEWKPR